MKWLDKLRESLTPKIAKATQEELVESAKAIETSKQLLQEAHNLGPQVEAVTTSLDSENDRNHYMDRLFLAWGIPNPKGTQ